MLPDNKLLKTKLYEKEFNNPKNLKKTIKKFEDYCNNQDMIYNSYGIDDLSKMGGDGGGYKVAPLFELTELRTDVRSSLISNDRSLCSLLYQCHALIRHGLQKPIIDAFNTLPVIQCGQVNANDIDKVYCWLQDENILQDFISTILWNDLFGGSGLIIDTLDNKNKDEFHISQLRQGQEIKFYSADLWELSMTNDQQWADTKPYIRNNHINPTPYNFYGNSLHKSRVFRITNNIDNMAPSLYRAQLRGWGYSKLEPAIPILNQAMKSQKVTYKILDQAISNWYFINDLGSMMNTPEGALNIKKQIEMLNYGLNYRNAGMMDAKDRMEMKQPNLTDIVAMDSHLLKYYAMAFDLPLSKWYGQTAGGLNAGQEDTESYYQKLQTYRIRYNHLMKTIIQIGFQVCTGIVPDEIKIEWSPLKVLSADQTANINKITLDMLTVAFDKGFISQPEVIRQINLAKLFPHEIKENNNIEGDNIFEKENQILDIQSIKKNELISVNKVNNKENQILREKLIINDKKKSFIDRIFKFKF